MIDWKKVWKRLDEWWLQKNVICCSLCDMPLDYEKVKKKIRQLVEKQIKKEKK